MEKIYFENIQQARLLHDEVAERVKTFISFRHFFDHQIVSQSPTSPLRKMTEFMRQQHICILEFYFTPGLLKNPEISHFRREKKKSKRISLNINL